MQVAAPTRSKLTSYSNLQNEAVALAEEINARHGDEALSARAAPGAATTNRRRYSSCFGPPTCASSPACMTA